MNYKRIIKSRQNRFAILKALSWVPDSIMLRIQYRIKNGRWPNLKHPKRFTEKLQLYKMKYRNPLMPQCVDKFEVRKFVESKGLGSILNELYGVYDKAEEIDFENLPQKFVIKTTDGGGGNTIIICEDKSKLDIPHTIKTVNSWLDAGRVVNSGREWAYTKIRKSRIIIEEFLESDGDLTDYKFFCFSGKPRYCQVITGRWDMECIDFFDRRWNHQKFVGLNPISGPKLSNAKICPMKPSNYEEMWKFAERMSSDFPFVRVDLYSIKGKTIFGELTFYPASGYGVFSTDDVDFELGTYFTIY